MIHTYSVENHDGVRVLVGSVPVSEATALTALWERQLRDEGHKPEDVVVDSWLGAHFGGPFALGTREACMALREKLGVRPRENR